ncbi:MAG TPA: hypothetical protein VE011_00575 [Candidatus Dormibacteraeota bacterium]|nr:hypothetical protein [Candidatus Dormibacteraeota bacterium]
MTDGLLPRAIRVPIGFGKTTTALDAGTGRQLLTLCEYRYTDGLGRKELLGAQLWLDRFAVPVRHVRDAARREFLDNRGQATSDDVALSFLIARQRPVIDAMLGLGYDARADAVDAIVGATLEGAPPSDVAVDAFAAVTGLTRTEVRERFGELPALNRVSLTDLLDLPDAEFEAARDRFERFAANVTPDQHRSGRKRARVRLGWFLSAFLIGPIADVPGVKPDQR